ncbi:DMT family transporter [Roseovarius sp. A21]|uniref:DMT family transporter n=1 Tax=Roseovarius bejariae TaxID=2576383 RepID=A0A844CFE9_9RHOB|nr:DMT family transporter [Roseovarius bejariae]MRU13981.1 DMT family transporter [Roseovarius bejariae]
MSNPPVIPGLVLCLFYTVLITGADAITKAFGQAYAAPQLFALSGLLVAGFSLVMGRIGAGGTQGLRTHCPRAMALRSGATVFGSLAFYHAFTLLPFAEVFIFVALIPILSALLSGPVLGEAVRGPAWGALGLGALGVMCLFPGGFTMIGAGHLIALMAVLLGTVSLVTARYIGRRDNNLLAQVFYPNLALGLVMCAALPFVYVPMTAQDVAWAVGYAVLLFTARWVLVAALQVLPAYVVTPLMNMQFVWMVMIGALVFGEAPGPGVYLGALIVIAAGLWVLREQARPVIKPTPALPAE